MSYATGTEVNVERSQVDIERLVKSKGAQRFYRGSDEERAMIAFELANRKIMFELSLPQPADFATVKVGRRTAKATPQQTERMIEQALRSRWRALMLCVKAKLVSVETGIETIEEAFLAQIIVPTDDGRARRFSQVAKAAIENSYKTGRPVDFGGMLALPSGET
jgi:hypothetical protein